MLIWLIELQRKQSYALFKCKSFGLGNSISNFHKDIIIIFRKYLKSEISCLRMITKRCSNQNAEIIYMALALNFSFGTFR